MILYKFIEKSSVRISHQIVKTDPGTYKNFLDFRNIPDFSEKLQIIFMIYGQIFAG